MGWNAGKDKVTGKDGSGGRRRAGWLGPKSILLGFVATLLAGGPAAFSLPSLADHDLAASAETIEFPVSRHTLSNGMTVLISPDRSLPIACLCLYFKVGSRNELPGMTGISHLVEHLRFSSGSQNFPPGEFDRIIEAAGGYSNGGTTKDYTLYWEEFVSSALEEVIRLEADRMRALKIEPSNFSREVQVVREERLLRTENDIFGTMHEQLFAHAYVAHPYRWPVIGWMKDLQAITIDQVKSYLASYYAPNNTVAILVGDLEEAEALSLMERYFGSIPAQPPPPPVIDSEPPQRGERRVWVKKEAELPALLVGYRTPGARDDDLYPLMLLENILSSGESSRIYRDLIYERQIASSAWAGLYDGMDSGLFLFYLQMRPGQELEEGERALEEILRQLREKGVAEEEVEKARRMAQVHLVRMLQGNSHRARSLGYYEVVMGDYGQLFSVLDRLEKVQAEDIQRVAQKYLDPDLRTTVILVPVREGR